MLQLNIYPWAFLYLYIGTMYSSTISKSLHIRTAGSLCITKCASFSP